jgi:hypothetical protein
VQCLHCYCNTALQQETATAKSDYYALSHMYHAAVESLDRALEEHRDLANEMTDQFDKTTHDLIKNNEATVDLVSYLCMQ